MRGLINANFPKIKILRSFLEYYSVIKAVRNESIDYIVPEATHSVKQQYPNYKSCRIISCSIKKNQNELTDEGGLKEYNVKKKVSIYERVKTDKIDQNQTTISTMPNLVHFLDSVLLMSVISRCRDKAIPIVTVHDCFYSNKKYLPQIKQFYTEAFIKYIIKDSAIDQLIQSLEYTVRHIFSQDFKLISAYDRSLLIKFLEADISIHKDSYKILNKDDLTDDLKIKINPIFSNLEIQLKIQEILDFRNQIDFYLIDDSNLQDFKNFEDLKRFTLFEIDSLLSLKDKSIVCLK